MNIEYITSYLQGKVKIVRVKLQTQCRYIQTRLERELEPT
jgi:hypothetical protein